MRENGLDLSLAGWLLGSRPTHNGGSATIPSFVTGPSIGSQPLVGYVTQPSAPVYTGTEPITQSYQWYSSTSVITEGEFSTSISGTAGVTAITGATSATYASDSAYYATYLVRETVLSNSAGTTYYRTCYGTAVGKVSFDAWAGFSAGQTDTDMVAAGYTINTAGGGVTAAFSTDASAPGGLTNTITAQTDNLKGFYPTEESGFLVANQTPTNYVEFLVDFVHSPALISGLRYEFKFLTTALLGNQTAGVNVYSDNLRLQDSTQITNSTSGTLLGALTQGSRYMVRMRVTRNGAATDIGAKLWTYGSTEPASFTTATDVAFDIGAFMFGIRYAASIPSDAFALNFWSFGANTPAPDYATASALVSGSGPYVPKTYYVDYGAAAPNYGTSAQPFSSINQAFLSGAINGTDAIKVSNTIHGAVTAIDSSSLTDYVTIESQNPSAAVIRTISLGSSSKYLDFHDMTVARDDADTSTSSIIYTTAGADYIKCRNLVVRSHDSSTTTQWLGYTAAQINAAACMGINLNLANHVTVTNCAVSCVIRGIGVGANSTIGGGSGLGNTIDGVLEDMTRMDGSGSTTSWNTGTNLFDTGVGYHADACQTYVGGGASNMLVENNTFKAWTLGASSLAGNTGMQGITNFDGTLSNFIVRNNLVITDDFHGISFYGGSVAATVNGLTVENNTVVAYSLATGTNPTVYLDTTTATPTNCIVANNVANQIGATADVPNNIVVDSNYALVSGDYTNGVVFTAPSTSDWTAVATGSLHGTGNATYAPATDITGTAFASPPNIGAYAIY